METDAGKLIKYQKLATGNNEAPKATPIGDMSSTNFMEVSSNNVEALSTLMAPEQNNQALQNIAPCSVVAMPITHNQAMTQDKGEAEMNESLLNEPDGDLHSIVNFGKEDEDEQYDYEYDDLLDEDYNETEIQVSHTPPIFEALMQPMVDSDFPPFTDQDVDEFINGPSEQHNYLGNSENSFHSVQNSMHSSSSVIRKLNSLDVDQAGPSNSNSSKRKGDEGCDDTASSVARHGKKSKK